MRRHEFQAPSEEEGNNGVWGAMVGYSFTAMHQFSCDSSPAPPDHLCLFACHIQAAWPFSCLSVYMYPSLPWVLFIPYLLSSARGGSRSEEREQGWDSSSQPPAFNPSPHPPGIARCDFSRLICGRWQFSFRIDLPAHACCHARLVDIRGRNCYIKSKQFLEACARSRGKALDRGVITAVETTFWHAPPMNTLKQSHYTQAVLISARTRERDLKRTREDGENVVTCRRHALFCETKRAFAKRIFLLGWPDLWCLG